MSRSSLQRLWALRARPRPPRTAAPTDASLRRRQPGAHPFAVGRARSVAAFTALLLPLGVMTATAGPAAAAPVGQGFTVTASDLSFILEQIRVAEAHVSNTTPATGPCGALVGPGPFQIPTPLISKGLRTVDGSCNNLVAGKEKVGAASTLFPRLTTPVFQPAGNVPPGFGPGGTTSYTQKSGNVFDTEPRVISNLIVDQTSTNPAAVAVAGFPVRTQGNTGVVPCTTDPQPSANPPVAAVPADCTPSFQTLFIPNVTTDVGLSPPFNSLFTIFGQFFDHGVDQTVKGGGTVFVPLKADDPLIPGPDHKLGTGCGTATQSPECADNLPPNLQFMVLSRARADGPGPDGKVFDDPATPGNETADNTQEATNTDSPWVDQSQTYTSNPAHQVYLRQYSTVGGKPVATGKLINQPDGGMGTWAMVKAQTATVLGLQLTDKDVLDIPMVAADAYGNFIPGPARGMPQFVTVGGLVEGNTTAPVAVPADVLKFDIPFLTDIAHNANPGKVGPCVTPGVPARCLNPDADTTASADFTAQPPGTYDDEMLDRHFIAGDGRVNENIGLTAVHQIFHSEHDRLAGEIETTLNDPANAALKAKYMAVDTTATGDAKTFTFGERVFQAARFVTEMEYQHLVFVEFARKVQPAINPFQPFAFTQTDLNPAIRAEFAHAMYRFGHSMLTETVPRRNEDKPGPDGQFGTSDDVVGTQNDISLLKAFLNPPEYNNGGPDGALTSKQAGGAILMGLSDQVGNEIDEFVTDTLRNNLLGLPLDLPTINIARARSEGIPSLNVLRRQLFAATNDGQLTPYINWIDFGENIKNPASLINFVAAYGQHPTILTDAGPDGIIADDPATAVDESADNGPATLASRRTAARKIVNPDATLGDVAPPDAAQFMNSIGPWANNGTASITGLDKIDLWMGGLAETTVPFGGLLGSTFNFIFENQLTDLQNGDRLYYLARTPGMNLRQQLEGNSFAEMIMRNTTAHTLKADAFATADCKFELKNLAGTPAGFANSGNTVADDPASECNETAVLIRMPDGTIQYRARNSVDPAGINGQSVYNGTAGPDLIRGGNDNDTFWGNEGPDRIEGDSGADVVLGGEGNDIITDLSGDDVLKGGPGNDAIDGGPGLDIIIGGAGKDFTNGGANANVTFGGEGDDFIYGGQGIDEIIADSGNDWIQGGDQPDLLIGDSSNLFFLDNSQTPGNDILIGQGGDDDYDMEGGDDIGVAGAGIEKIAGASGYDWQIGQGEATAQDLDLTLPLVPLDVLAVGVRDKFNEVEALSGWNGNDKIRGDSIVPSAVGGAGFIGCDVLDQAGLDRIAGLDPLIPDLAILGNGVVPLADVVAGSASKNCPVLTGPNVWGGGNVLLGGAGSDLIEGRGADDVIDGDKYLNVRLSIRTDPAVPASEIGTTDLMENRATSGNFGAGTVGRTLQESVFAGLVDPGNIVAVREILAPAPNAADVDTALFSGASTEYTITKNADGSVTVAHTGGTAADGTDTLTNVEVAQFTDRAVSLVPNAPAAGAPVVNFGTNTTLTPNVARLSPQEAIALPPVTTTGITDPNGLGTFSFQWQQRGAGSTLAFANITGATASTFTPTQAVVGRELRVLVSFTDGRGNPEAVASAATVVGDLFAGTLNGDVFNGNAGEDLARGGAGNDNLSTLAGNDVVSGDAGNDIINTGSGDDVIQFTGSQGFDNITGGSEFDRIEAGANNTVIGLSGVTGVEEITGKTFSGVSILGSPAADNFNFSAVTLTNIASIDGGAGNDIISLPDTPDVVLGGAGADIIDGGGGDDTITGGAGNDILQGGPGLDQFVYGTVFGADVIQPGFDAEAFGGQDRIDLRAAGVTVGNFAQRVIITASGANTLITVRIPVGTRFVTTGTITVRGVASSEFTATGGDFIVNP